jgi:hypothetical protein
MVKRVLRGEARVLGSTNGGECERHISVCVESKHAAKLLVSTNRILARLHAHGSAGHRHV